MASDPPTAMVPTPSRRETLHAVAATAAVVSAGCVGFGPGASDDPDIGLENRDDEEHTVVLDVEPAGGNATESAHEETTLAPDERVAYAGLLPYYDARSTYRVVVTTNGQRAAEQTVRVDGPESEVGDLLVAITGAGTARIDFGPDVSVDAGG